MPLAIRAVVAFNIVASIVVVFVAYSFGGGFSPTPFPPDREIVLEPLEPAPAPSSPEHAPRSQTAFEVPMQFSRPEPMAARWQTLPDGTVRFLD
jgi:hypothetical protein